MKKPELTECESEFVMKTKKRELLQDLIATEDRTIKEIEGKSAS